MSHLHIACLAPSSSSVCNPVSRRVRVNIYMLQPLAQGRQRYKRRGWMCPRNKSRSSETWDPGDRELLSVFSCLWNFLVQVAKSSYTHEHVHARTHTLPSYPSCPQIPPLLTTSPPAALVPVALCKLGARAAWLPLWLPIICLPTVARGSLIKPQTRHQHPLPSGVKTLQ